MLFICCCNKSIGLIVFLIGVCALQSYEWVQKQKSSKIVKYAFIVFSFCFFMFLSLFCEYGIFGFCFLFCLYFYLKKQNYLWLFWVLLFSILINPSEYKWIISLITTTSLLCINFDTSAPRLIKHWWIFYVCYPLHLFLLSFIKLFIGI